MAHEMLSAKLCEMDSQLSKLHSRIRISEQYSDDRLNEEITALRMDIESQISVIQESLELSKADISTELLLEFKTLRDGIDHAVQALQEEQQLEEETDFQSEQQILAAEYYIDFAVIVAKNALLQALEAERISRRDTTEF